MTGGVNCAIAGIAVTALLTYMNWPTFMIPAKLFASIQVLVGVGGAGLGYYSDQLIKKHDKQVNAKPFDNKERKEVQEMLARSSAIGMAACVALIGLVGCSTYLHPTFGIKSSQFLLSSSLTLLLSAQLGHLYNEKQSQAVEAKQPNPTIVEESDSPTKKKVKKEKEKLARINSMKVVFAVAAVASLLTVMNWPTFPSCKPLLTVTILASSIGAAAGLSEETTGLIEGVFSKQPAGFVLAAGSVAAAALLGVNGIFTYLHPTLGVHTTQYLLTAGMGFLAANRGVVYCMTPKSAQPAEPISK